MVADTIDQAVDDIREAVQLWIRVRREQHWPLPPALRESGPDVNIRAVVSLAHAALTAMTQHGSGTVLNMSSTVGLQPFPGSATYAATKAFVTSFSEALHEEARGTARLRGAVPVMNGQFGLARRAKVRGDEAWAEWMPNQRRGANI